MQLVVYAAIFFYLSTCFSLFIQITVGQNLKFWYNIRWKKWSYQTDQLLIELISFPFGDCRLTKLESQSWQFDVWGASRMNIMKFSNLISFCWMWLTEPRMWFHGPAVTWDCKPPGYTFWNRKVWTFNNWYSADITQLFHLKLNLSDLVVSKLLWRVSLVNHRQCSTAMSESCQSQETNIRSASSFVSRC